MDFFADVQPDGERKPVAILNKYANDASHFVVDTAVGPIRIPEIFFRGTLWMTTRKVPIEALHEYLCEEGGGHIAQVAVFPVEWQGRKVAIEMHNIPDSGHTHVLLRAR